MLMNWLNSMLVPLLEWMALIVYFTCVRHPAPYARQIAVCLGALPVFTGITFAFRQIPYTGWSPTLPVVVFMADFALLLLGTGQRWKSCLYLATHALMHTQTTVSFTYALVLSDMMRSVGHLPMRPLVMVLIGAILCILATLMESYALYGTTLENVSWRTIAIALLFMVSAVIVANRTTATSLDLFSKSDTSTFLLLRNALYLRTITLLLVDSVMYGQQIMRHWHTVRRENNDLRSVMRDQEQQYLLSQENLHEIHRLSHDMKHYLLLLQDGPHRDAAGNDDERLHLIEQLNESIDSSSLMQQSGNPTLDAIILDKRQLCGRHHIELIVMADGAVLDHVEPLDLTSLVGNMLDNAIEACAQVADSNKRIIHFTVQCKQRFAVLHVDNHFDPTTLRQGAKGLLTNKTKDVGSHGHGLRSIKKTARKYGGNAAETIDYGHDVFNMDVMLPLPAHAAVL